MTPVETISHSPNGGASLFVLVLVLLWVVECVLR